MFDLKIEGHRRLNKKLNRLSLTVARRIVRPATRTALEPVVKTAQMIAPVGETGRMSRFIKPFVKNSRRYGLTGYVRTGTRKQLRIPESAKYYYPVSVEYGTRYMKARPFLRAAMAKEKRQVLKILGREIHKGLKKV